MSTQDSTESVVNRFVGRPAGSAQPKRKSESYWKGCEERKASQSCAAVKE